MLYITIVIHKGDMPAKEKLRGSYDQSGVSAFEEWRRGGGQRQRELPEAEMLHAAHLF